MKNRTKIQYAIVIALLQIQSIFAQAPVFDDDVQDVPAAPINDWIIPAIVVMIVMVYFYFLKQKPCTNK